MDRLQREVDEDWERLLAQAAMKGCV
jgi:hypothetical protein